MSAPTAAPDPATLPESPGAALLAANRRRARTRRVLLWIAVPLAVIALLGPVKIASMYAFAHRSITAYVAGDYAGAVAAAHGQQPLNWFEPYKAPYNLGDGLAMSGDLAAARAQFERALPLASGLEACAVHINLGITIERMGDQARAEGDVVGAEQLYGEALTVVAETPEECRSEEADDESPDPQRDTGQSLDDLEGRLKDKQRPQPSPTPTPSPDPSQPDQPSGEQLEDLEQKLQEGEGERQQYQGGGEPAGPETDKPW
ncbi:tetratricopeptide repeat protein [Microbacterium sp. NPDC096154]|uniref:tetratricopeptide repeat protein n=1 Tax=Microbacterium sp. NPDC096154 TaxID=3155549 RepID=UPI003326C243